MIKGHSGSGSRSAAQEDFLRLSDYRDSDNIGYPSGSSSSESPARGVSEESDRFSFPPAIAPAALPGYHSPYNMYPHDGWSPYHQENIFF